MTPHDTKMRDALAGQDWLSTVVEQSAAVSAARVTGVMTDFLPPMNGPAIIRALSDPAIRIVSLTVTEGGYFVNPALGKFDPDSPAIVADARNPDDPKTVFGLILAGLKARKAAGVAPFTVMSCDNVPHNGKESAAPRLAGLAEAQDKGFAAWVHDSVAFPNAMVDRIAPATSDRERAITRDQFGIDDAWPVFCEDFLQWVVEDDFSAGRPAFEDVGAEFVKDVTPWELMKIRILNGPRDHRLSLRPHGHPFRPEGMEDPLVRAFLRKVEREEVIPIVPPVPGTDLDGYFQKVEERCLNPKIGDTIRRLCLDGSNRQPKFIIPSIADRLDRGLDVTGLALESALWCRYCYGVTDSGAVIRPNDPNWDRLMAAAESRARIPPTGSECAISMAPPPELRRLSRSFRHQPAGALGGRNRGDAPTVSRRRNVKPPPDLVIFDCDGVLVDSEPVSMRILLETIRSAGLSAEPAVGYELSAAALRASAGR